MNPAQRLASASAEPMSWAEICEQYSSEWVCLTNVESDRDGAICSARVFTHDRSMRKVLAEIGAQPELIVVHTGGRPLASPRIEWTDEIRNIVRPRR